LTEHDRDFPDDGGELDEDVGDLLEYGCECD